ncbi:MAG: hypothetical protein KY461_11810 [Actinobacteria bacterium]|nr:hypothetical protein [Actinomycetota bacterium]
MTRWLRNVATRAPVPVFAVAGAETREAVQTLRLDGRVRLVSAPRQASVLLIAGRLPETLLDAAVAAHDVMPTPRATVLWLDDPLAPPPHPFADAPVHRGGDVASALVDVQHALLRGSQPSEPPVRPDIEPAPWRGEGPYGQGGAGMTGGVPYGRPMATREDDRDGLTLDVLPVPVGPLFSGFPDGLTARVTFAGDLVHRFELGTNPYGDGEARALDDPFWRALHEPVPIAELEVARARSLLRWASEAARVAGLDALSLRTLALAERAEPGDAAAVRALGRWLTHPLVTGRQHHGVAALDASELGGLGLGPVSRASGIPDDLRSSDPAYVELGFETICHDDGDAAARWRQRLAEAEQALELAARAGSRRTGGSGAVESPRGRLEPDSSPTSRSLPLLPDLVTGMEWGDAVTTIVSLDLDLPEAAAIASVAGAPA